MSRVRQSGTSAELVVRRLLSEHGVDYEILAKDLSGSPDLVNRMYKWAIFVNGCFWHAHEGCKRSSIPKTNQDFWKKKLTENQKRDKSNIDHLKEKGYSVLVIWECELINEVLLIKKIMDFVLRSSQSS